MKPSLRLFFAVLGTLTFVFSPAFLSAELPEINQEEDLNQRYQEGVQVKRNTMEAPLLTSGLGAAKIQNAIAGFEEAVRLESSKNVQLKPAGQSAFRLQYESLETPAEVTWHFKSPADLSNRWFRMDYSGLMIPPHVFLTVHPLGNLHDESLNLFLESSSNPQSVYFKLPGRSNYQAVELLKMIIDPSVLQEKKGDFMVLNLQLLGPQENPLMKPAPKAAERQTS